MPNRREVLSQMGAVITLGATGAQAREPRKPLRVVDSQVHLWRNATPSSLHRQRSIFWVEDLLPEMKAAGVDAAVICPPAFYPEGNETYRQVVEQYPDRFATWGFFPIDAPDREERIKTWRRPPYMLGLRYTFLYGDTPRYWTDGTMDWLWPAAEKAGVPLGFYGFGHLDTIADKAARHPGLKIVIDHMCADVTRKGPDAFVDFPKLLTLSRYPNVAVKISGMPAQSAESYPFRDTHELVRRCIETFGAARCMWGTDLTRMPCSYRQCVTMFTEEMPWLEGENQRLVMGEAIMRWLDFQPQGWKA